MLVHGHRSATSRHRSVSVAISRWISSKHKKRWPGLFAVMAWGMAKNNHRIHGFITCYNYTNYQSWGYIYIYSHGERTYPKTLYLVSSKLWQAGKSPNEMELWRWISHGQGWLLEKIFGKWSGPFFLKTNGSLIQWTDPRLNQNFAEVYLIF
jgi:hypothetical protein